MSDLDPKFFTIISTALFASVILFINDKKISNILSKVNNSLIKKEKLSIDEKKYFRYLFLFLAILIVIFQGQYLDFETIDSDIHTYLIVGNDVLKGSLPYENEWDDKGPVFYIFYALLIFISNKNLIVFKLLCDVLLLLITFNLAKLIYQTNKYKKEIHSLLGSTFFVLLLSTPWGSVEYSEIFCLFFMCPSFYLILKDNPNKKDLFFSGVLYGLSTLVNQGSGVFILLFIYLLYKSDKFKYLSRFITGFSLPHILIFILYTSRNLLDIYFSTLVTIPLKYSGQNFNLFHEFNVFLRETFFYSPFIYLGIIFLFVFSIYRITNIKIFDLDLFPYFGTLLSLIFFYLGSTGYKHHLIFLLFFLCLLPIYVSSNKKSYYWVFALLLFCSISSLAPESSKKSFKNLTNINIVYSNYPLRNLSFEIKDQFNEDYTIFSLDHSLILFYLDKENESFIIHPTNYIEPSIFNELVHIGRVVPDELPYQISKKPNVVLCSKEIRSVLVDVNCEVTDFFKGYKKIDTNIYFKNSKRSYYKDPYRSIDLYIRSN